MEIKLLHGAIQDASDDTIVVNLFKGVGLPGGATGAVDRSIGGKISEIISYGDFSGDLGESLVVYPGDAVKAKRIIVVGLGDRESFDLDAIRTASAKAVETALDCEVDCLYSIVHGAGIGSMDTQAAALATVEGAFLAAYDYKYRSGIGDQKHNEISFRLVEYDSKKVDAIRHAVDKSSALMNGVYMAMDLVNSPANIATPSKMAEYATEIAHSSGMELFIGDRKWAGEMGMGAFLGVAKGAGEEPKFIILEHQKASKDKGTIVLVGKGITFDTGGISIKPSLRMEEMKSDMAGAAAVLGTMQVIGEMNLPLNVIGITPCTENMPDANAYRPADVISASNGKKIEVVNTDAEGRLVLADALVYAARYSPDFVIDLATLTGSCVIALGRGIAAGLFSNNDELSQRLMDSGRRTGERLWPLPLWDDYKEAIKSDSADIKNTGGRYGGVGTSAIFLKEFIDYPWAHLDIAGMALNRSKSGYLGKGATGFGVRLLVDFLTNWQMN